MVEQVAVFNVVNAALGVEELHMLLQLLALAKRLHQFVQHQPLIVVEGGGVFGVHRGERSVPQRILLVPDPDGLLLPVDAAEVIAALHLEIRVAVNDLALHLEHQDGDSLVHDRAPVEHSLRVGAAGRIGVGHPDGQVIVAVELLSHPLQMAQVDAIAVLQHGMVVVGQRGLEDRADADGAAGGGAHPDHIMVAPLDIDVMVAHEQVQDDIRAGAAVKQVAHNVQLIHGQPLDELTQADNETVRAAIFNNTAHDLAIIEVFIVVLKMGVEQLVQNITAAGGQAGTHMLPGVLGRNQTAEINEAEQRLGIPLLQRLLVRALGLELGQFLIGVIDQRCQLGTVRLRDRIPQHDIHFFADDAGGRVQDMYKGFVFAVQIAHKMLGTLGQLEQSLGTDDLAGRRSLRGVIPCKQG